MASPNTAYALRDIRLRRTSYMLEMLYEMPIFKGVRIKNAPKRFNISRLAEKNKR